MKKLYKIVALLTAFVFLTTYNPSEFNIFSKNKNFFFKIKNIEILNNNIIDENEIDKKLQHLYGKNILIIERDDIGKSLRAIDFLEKTEVKKKYPNTLIIKIYETKPVAVLFKKNKKYILDSSSNLISWDQNINMDNFPNVFGENAENYFVNFFKILADNDFPEHQVKSYYYFQVGRWDLQFFNDQVIKFPDEKINEAIQQSVELLERKDFKNYNIIDLRMHGKIIVE